MGMGETMSGMARGLTGVSCVLLAAVAAAGCSAGRATSYRPTEDACYHLAVQALQRHVVLPADPPACAGLSPAEVNMAVARAIREATGARPKAMARHLASLARPYLNHLVRAIPPAVTPPAPAPPGAPPGAPQAAARARSARDLPLDLAALGAWVLTASAGLYMLAPWLVRWLARRRRRADSTTAFTLGHFGLALTGLGIWIAFVATDLPALAWVALCLVVLIAGLGMGVLAAALPEPAHAGATARRAERPVTVIAAHGTLATLTILLVLTAAIGAG
jgi:manganese efflux pump family protein